MSDTLYDKDVLLWSEQQAEALRRLSASPARPNDIDFGNVIEEIEEVGLSFLAACRSLIRQCLIHLVKLAADPAAEARQHWLGEIDGCRDDLKDRFVNSMRQRIDIDAIWATATERVARRNPAYANFVAGLPSACPFSIDDLLSPAAPEDLADRIAKP
jgi:hypothetical protein